MSSQDGDGIPFEIANDLENLRLLELPPSLLESIRSTNPPLLKLKSAATPDGGGQEDAAYAMLCTQTETFQVRQVQTSNSVFVLQPKESPVEPESDAIPVTSLRAIAKCPNMLELVPTKPNAVSFLKQNLPTYMSEGLTGTDTNEQLSRDKRKDKKDVLEDAPFSDGEFEEAWTKLCAFEDGKVAWIPTAGLLVKGWGTMLTAATIRGLKIHETFPISSMTSTADEDGCPMELIKAILKRVSSDDQELMDGYAKLDSVKCVSWVGSTYLDSLGGEVAVPRFLEQWQDKLPEVWRDEAALDKLKGSFRENENATITYDETAYGEKPTASKGSKASTGRARPNWHERFKASKK